MTVFVFSNCKKTTDDQYLKNVMNLGIKDTDHLVFMNHANLLYPFPYFKKFPNIHVFLRAMRLNGFSFFFGAEDAHKHAGFVKNVYTLDQMVCEIKTGDIFYFPVLMKGVQGEVSTTHITGIDHGFIREYKLRTGKDCPTTGFMVWHIVQDLFHVKPADVVLLNFYGSKDNSTPKCSEHDWAYEEEYFTRHARRMYV